MKKRTIAFTGGGTAGHVFPAFPVIERLKRADYDVFWIGSTGGMERSLVEQGRTSLHRCVRRKIQAVLVVEKYYRSPAHPARLYPVPDDSQAPKTGRPLFQRRFRLGSPRGSRPFSRASHPSPMNRMSIRDWQHGSIPGSGRDFWWPIRKPSASCHHRSGPKPLSWGTR